jgi:hypothetical protein
MATAEADRALTAMERIAMRHVLQVAAERCRVLRDAMDPQHGVASVKVWALATDIERIVGPLIRAEQQAMRGEVQRNVLPGTGS